MESDELSFSPVHSGQDFYFDDPDESKEGVKLEPRKPGEGFSGHAPPGTWAELAHGTHVPRLLSDHLRHLVMVAYGSVDVYEKNEMAFLGTLTDAAAKVGISSLNVVAGAFLVIGVLPNLASKMTLICQYKKRLELAEEMVRNIGKALDGAKKELEELSPDDRKDVAKCRHLRNIILYLSRELDRTTAARDALIESTFRLSSAANNVVEVAAGSVRIAKAAGGLGAHMSTQATAHLATAVPALGIAVGGFWAIYGGVMTARSTKDYLRVNGELKQTKAEIFIRYELDEATSKRLSEFHAAHMGERKTDEELRAALKEEHEKACREAEEKHPGAAKAEEPKPLTAEQYKAYARAQAEAPPDKPAPAKKSLAERCKALKRAVLEKKSQLLTLERRKQICRVCHFALLTAVGVLGIAAGAVAIAFSGGAATPFVLLGLFGLMVIVGGGVFGSDVMGGILEKAKKKEGSVGLSPELKHRTGIRRLEDLGPMAHEIFESSEILEERARYLRAMGVGDGEENPTQTCLEYAATEGEILEALTHHFGILFPKEPEEEMRHLLYSFGIEHVSSAAELADDILSLVDVGDVLSPKTAAEALLEKMGIDLKDVEGGALMIDSIKLAEILDKRFSGLFPKEEKLRQKLYDFGVTCLTTPEALAKEILASDDPSKRLALLKDLGIKEKEILDSSQKPPTLSSIKLSETLRTRCGYLFPNMDSVLDHFDEYGIRDFTTAEALAAEVFGIEPELARNMLLRKLGINPNNIKEEGLTEIFKTNFQYLFPDLVRKTIRESSIDPFSTPAKLIEAIQGKGEIARKALLQQLGIDASLWEERGTLADILERNFPYLFSSLVRESFAIQGLTAFTMPSALAESIKEMEDVIERTRLLQRLGIDPSLGDKPDDLASLLERSVSSLFPAFLSPLLVTETLGRHKIVDFTTPGALAQAIQKMDSVERSELLRTLRIDPSLWDQSDILPGILGCSFAYLFPFSVKETLQKQGIENFETPKELAEAIRGKGEAECKKLLEQLGIDFSLWNKPDVVKDILSSRFAFLFEAKVREFFTDIEIPSFTTPENLAKTLLQASEEERQIKDQLESLDEGTRQVQEAQLLRVRGKVDRQNHFLLTLGIYYSKGLTPETLGPILQKRFPYLFLHP